MELIFWVKYNQLQNFRYIVIQIAEDHEKKREINFIAH